MGRSFSGLAGGGANELLAQQAGQEQQRASWPVARHDVLGLPGVVAGHQDDTAAADLSDVVLDEAVLAAGAGELVLLAIIQKSTYYNSIG